MAIGSLRRIAVSRMKKLNDILEEPTTEFAVEYRVHATRRMFERQITNREIDRLLAHGRIIEEYDDSPPFRHVLLSGRGEKGRTLHLSLVIQLLDKVLTIITVYEPDPAQWNDSFTRRKP